jgi:Ser/Thr protein kinase RdoA (MazF antagonist)
VELPVVCPLTGNDGQTLQTLQDTVGQDFYYSLYPRKSGRQFDAERPQDWLRLGNLVGRLHLVGKSRKAPQRLQCHPLVSGSQNLQELYDSQIIHPEVEAAFIDLCEELLVTLEPGFNAAHLQRIHGDCHRGNIFDRPGEGLLLLDFDDMMQGPAVQDLWLLLPDRMDCCRAEYGLVLEGYREFLPFNPEESKLVEGLRFMRMLHYLAWCARQRYDRGFLDTFPDWGSRSFWIKELEDFRLQAHYVQTGLVDDY